MPVQQKTTIGHLATDPLRNFRFLVNIAHSTGMINLGFMSVDGLNVTTEVITYRQGGYNTTTQKMPGQSDFAPITLSRGLAIGDHHIWDWQRELFTVMQGTGTRQSGATDFRQTFDIQVLDHPVTQGAVPIKAQFRIYNAWPTSVAFSGLDAGANAIIVQQLTLAHEGFEVRVAPSLGTSEPNLQGL